MESKGGSKVLLTLLLTVCISQSLQSELVNQKTYYSPPSDPHAVTPPHHVPSAPRHHRTPSACPPPPYGTNCGCTPAPPHGGGSPPSHGGGGYYNNPPPSPAIPTPTIPIGPPSTPTTPLTPPSTPLIPVDPNTPPFNPGGSPPFIPVDPNTPPFNPGGSPPFIPIDPNSPPLTPGGTPGTCIFWSTNPTIVWGIFGYWATVGGLFGPTTTLPFGSNLSVHDALANTRRDGYGALYREGMASFLNSMIVKRFPFTTEQVRKAFAHSMANEKMAANQARIFKLANEGHLKNH